MEPHGGGSTRPVTVGVAGGSGSGKSTFVDRVVDCMPGVGVCRLHHDSYYRDTPNLTAEQRSAINYDHPDSLETELLERHVRMLREGQAVEVPTYDFTCHRRREETLEMEPAAIIIVEGILVLASERLRPLLDVRVYVETESDLRFIRRLLRDTRERNRSLESVVAQYETTVRPMHLEFVAPSRQHAHVVVPWARENQVAVELVVARLREAAARP